MSTKFRLYSEWTLEEKRAYHRRMAPLRRRAHEVFSGPQDQCLVSSLQSESVVPEDQKKSLE
jgi:hypothetical protein